MPEGFFHFEPTLASTLFGPNPMENVNPSSVSRSRFMLSAIRSYDMRSGQRSPVRSAKHSSMLYSSTCGV
jgi:hypothetical protein